MQPKQLRGSYAILIFYFVATLFLTNLQELKEVLVAILHTIK